MCSSSRPWIRRGTALIGAKCYGRSSNARVPYMTSKIRVTFRFKILLSVLIVVTTVVSLITFTMARMFHADKVAYVEDLVSLVSVHAAEEADLRLTAYRDHLITAGTALGPRPIFT